MSEMNVADNIRVVLVSPLYGGNVGSVCRAMGNMGLSRLMIAAPGNLDMGEARKMACHARDILESRREAPGLKAAVADCAVVVGTSARLGLYRAHSSTPREFAPEILNAARDRQVAIVFGPEDNGLGNDDLAVCTHILQIPTVAGLSSLNLSQAVLICLYEIFLVVGSFEPSEEKAPVATTDLRERMFEMWREMLMDVGFMKDDMADHMMMGIRRVFSRGALTTDDVRILMGVARQAHHAARRGKAASEPQDEIENEVVQS
ncbi:MAG: TrmJ/YjtD family RNA methyltransferase [Verrucomicrobia bacterium]|nr:TrmJ/YjtD family RNA methyltransferase [Verrucomicrobiota bacterium]